jgi:hypothetical protein
MPLTLADLLINLAKSDPEHLMKSNGTPNQQAIARRLTKNCKTIGLDGSFNHVRINGYLRGIAPRQEIRPYLAAALGISSDELLSAIRASAGIVAGETDAAATVTSIATRLDGLAADVAELRAQRAADAAVIAKVVEATKRIRKATGTHTAATRK